MPQYFTFLALTSKTIKNEGYQKPHSNNGDAYSISNTKMGQYNESTGNEPKSTWKSLCSKSLEIARIMNSFSIKMAKMLLSTLDQIHQFVHANMNEVPNVSENITNGLQNVNSKVTSY